MSKQTLMSRVDVSTSLRFSGSQSITKGSPVVWILNEFDAFKLTEKCKVSMDATPFVNFKAGNEFIIKKGATYIFDRDTEVALAYPQEKTQDILIENNNYNDVHTNVTIEAEKAPVAHAGSNQRVTIGQAVRVVGSDYPIPPATIAKREWILNGVVKGNTNIFSYIPARAGRDDLIYRITDSGGRIAQDNLYVDIQEKAVIDDYSQGEVGKGGCRDCSIVASAITVHTLMTVGKTTTGKVNIVATFPVKHGTAWEVRYWTEILLNGVPITATKHDYDGSSSAYTHTENHTYVGTLKKGDTLTARTDILEGTIYKQGVYAGTPQINLTVTERTK